jgi:hypothetical protein
MDKQDTANLQEKFSITINLGGATAGPAPIVVDISKQQNDQFMLSIPEFITPTMADANLTDLAYMEAQ